MNTPFVVLSQISHRLRLLGQLVFFLTIGAFGLQVATRLGSFPVHSIRDYQMVVGMLVAGPILALAATAYYDSVRRHGNALYEELSDAYQYRLQRGLGDGAVSPEVSLDERIMLRSYAQATNLPLIPGQMGPAIYAAVNIALILYAVTMI